MQTITNNAWLKEYMSQKANTFHSLPNPSWKRINHADISLEASRDVVTPIVSEIKDDHNTVVVKESFQAFSNDETFNPFIQVNTPYGLGEKFVAMGEAFFNTGVCVKVNKNKKPEEPIYITFKADRNTKTINDHNIIVAERGSEVTVIFDYLSEDETETLHNGITKIFVEENATVHVVKLQRLNDSSLHYDSNVAIVQRNAKVQMTSIELGSKVSASSYVINLEGTASEAELGSLYFLDEQRKADIGYTMNHNAPRTISYLEAVGAMKDQSKKVFRGNLNLNRGASQAKGAELEYVTLLDATAKSDSIPALFCDEDDVEGQHAASVGQIDENKLFYLMSRGLEEKEAKKMIVEANFRPIIDKLPLESLQEIVSLALDRRLQNV